MEYGVVVLSAIVIKSVLILSATVPVNLDINPFATIFAVPVSVKVLAVDIVMPLPAVNKDDVPNVIPPFAVINPEAVIVLAVINPDAVIVFADISAVPDNVKVLPVDIVMPLPAVNKDAAPNVIPPFAVINPEAVIVLAVINPEVVIVFADIFAVPDNVKVLPVDIVMPLPAVNKDDVPNVIPPFAVINPEAVIVFKDPDSIVLSLVAKILLVDNT
jgi:hypothetical protein